MKKIKNGFSMVELLFVMAIMAALAAIAIPSLSSGSDSATLTSMKSDAQNTISTLQATYVDTMDYSKIIPEDYTDVIDDPDDNDGFADDEIGENGDIKVALSKGNKITLTAGDNGGDYPESCFVLKIKNDNLENKVIKFSSCDDGKIQVQNLVEE